ncbi:hypothetical protein CcaCcLH18_09332 [Colletotrichum camelliae]|nr:hypothetical protein CcaCcLH18_09332 [Colletotrichum camelliae]
MSNQRNITTAPAHAKYNYKTRGYFPRQTKWLDLTVSLFNADVADVLLSEAEKKCVLIDLSRGFTKSETLGNSGDIYHNTTVCAAILRHQLQIPEHWLEDPTFRQYHDGMVYLRDCSMGAKAYSKKGIKRAMRGAEFAGSQHERNPGGGEGDAPTGPRPKPENTPQTSAIKQDKSRKRKEPEAPPPSTLASGSTVSGGQSSASQVPRQNKRRVERDESSATLQGHIKVIEIKSEDEDEDEDEGVKPAIKRPRKHAGSDGEESRNCVGNDTTSQINAVETRNAAEAQHEVERQITTETNAADMQQTITELRRMMQFLPDIAASQSKTFWKDILRPRIAIIQSNGWNDLVQWARQLVVASGREYRQYVAEQLQEKLTERVNKLSG